MPKILRPTWLCMFSVLWIQLFACAQSELLRVDSIENKAAIKVWQTVNVAENSIIVTVNFENVSKTPVLIIEGARGIPEKGRPQKIYPIYEPEFSITLNGQPIRYIGPIGTYLPFTRKHFASFEPKEKAQFSVQIANSFNFLPGEHEYSIVHHHLRLDEMNELILEYESPPLKFKYWKK